MEKDDDVPILRKDLWKAAARATCLKHLACVGRAADLVKLAAPIEELSAEVHELEEGMEGMDLGEEEGELLARASRTNKPDKRGYPAHNGEAARSRAGWPSLW